MKRSCSFTGPDEHGNMYVYFPRKFGVPDKGAAKKTLEHRGRVMLDYDEDGKLIGIELCDVVGETRQNAFHRGEEKD